MLKHVTAFLILFSLAFHSGFAQCNLEQRSLYEDDGEIDSFQKRKAWRIDLNKDGIMDTVVKYQIEEGNEGYYRYNSTKGLIVLAEKTKNGDCNQVKSNFISVL